MTVKSALSAFTFMPTKPFSSVKPYSDERNDPCFPESCLCVQFSFETSILSNNLPVLVFLPRQDAASTKPSNQRDGNKLLGFLHTRSFNQIHLHQMGLIT